MAISRTPLRTLRDPLGSVSFARALLNVVREVNAWRKERDAFVAMHVEEMRRRRDRHAP
jgi:hypothetical protein